ncbi:penicillin-insensitive murein endopeptidase, partial [Salmonella enterica subsp. enterica serovar Enteritidis]|nr:penicillin-insensitive murein endopeptidase [Salmonella enterica subsp. enterica serovar Enteritidis]
VNPAIKKKLCDTVSGDRSWLSKVRPIYGHDYHFHIRIGCQAGSSGCKQQEPTPNDDGCGKPLAWWFTEEPWRPAKPGAKPQPRPRDVMTMASLPKACMAVLKAPDPASLEAVTYHGPGTRLAAPVEPAGEVPIQEPAEPVRAGVPLPKADVPLPTPRP